MFRRAEIKVILLLLATTLMMSTLTMVPSVQAQGEAKVFVEPAESTFFTYEKGVNDTFQVNVTIANMTGLVGFQFELTWNSSLLNGISITDNLFSTVTPPGEVGNIWILQRQITATKANYAYTYQDLDQAIAGGYAPINITEADGYPQGKLVAAIIVLEIVAAPPQGSFVESSLELTISKPGDRNGQNIPHTTEDGYYKLTSPGPTMMVEPDSYTATSRNETFDVDVTITNIQATSEFVGAEFKLLYDTTLLSVENVTEGPFMTSFAGPPNQGTMFVHYEENNHVLVGIMIYPDENGTWHAPFPSGNGVLATINFKVIHGPPVSGALDLADTKLGDTNANPINHTAIDGHYEFNVETLSHTIVADSTQFTVTTTSNGTISPVPMNFDQGHARLSFNVWGANDTSAFVNVTIPNALLWLCNVGDSWLVQVGGYDVTPIVTETTTHTSLYFTLTLSQKPVSIFATCVIAEFPMPAVMLLAIIAISMIALAAKKRRPINRNANMQI